MKDLLFSVNTVLPMALLLLMGYGFRKTELFSAEFVAKGNRFCFYVLLSCSLFKNLYDSELSAFPLRMSLFTAAAVLTEFVIAVLLAKHISDEKRQQGVIVQGSFRSNFAYIGIPLSTMMFTDEVLSTAARNEISILSVIVIPMFNILAVIALTYMNEMEDAADLLKNTFYRLRTNPCILSVLSGIAVLLLRMVFPSAGFFLRDHLNSVYKVIGYLANMSTPFALLLVGANLNISDTVSNAGKLWMTVLLKDVLFPGAVLLAAVLAGGFSQVDYAVMISAFAAPTAVGSAIMARELKGDGELASEIVVYTTLFSIVSLTLIIYIMRVTGCL